MGRGLALAAGAALLSIAPISASALGISIVNVSSSGGNAALLEDGDILTVDLRLENNTNIPLQGLGIGVTGYDRFNDGAFLNDHLRFVGGAVATSAFNVVAGFGGLPNIRTAPTEIGTPPPISNPRRVQLFDAASLSPSDGDGSLDTGVDGDLVGNGDVHFRIQFRAVAGLTGLTGNSVTLNFGTGLFGNVAIGVGGVEVPFQNASYTVGVVPEPGTALLMGLGLAGLATAGRR
jgi:hypothetical protein